MNDRRQIIELVPLIDPREFDDIFLKTEENSYSRRISTGCAGSVQVSDR